MRDEIDRRRVLVELTEEAHDRNSEIWGPIAEASVAMLSRHSNDELVFIRDFLRSSRGFLSEHLERVKALPPTSPPSSGRKHRLQSPTPE